MRAQLLSIGSELMLGHLTDTNATYLAQQLAGLGIELTLVTQVGDDLERLAGAIRRALADADAVICTGGVGPTADDLTREAIALVVQEEPRIDPELLSTIEAFFRGRGLEMPERNRKQAWVIPSSETLPNPVGTAPGWFVRTGGRVIVAMPGVPREMFRMWRDQAVPRLLDVGGHHAVRTITFRTIGIGESAAEQVLHDLVAIENPVVATYAKDDGVHVRVTAMSESDIVAEQMRDEIADEVRRRLVANIYATDDTSLPEAIAAQLSGLGTKLAVVDAGGGSRFASVMSSHPASSKVLAKSTAIQPHEGLTVDSMAEIARGDSNGGIGVGILVTGKPEADNVYQSIIAVAVRGLVNGDDSTPMRSGYEDIQRRSGLVAADVLRKALQRGTAN